MRFKVHILHCSPRKGDIDLPCVARLHCRVPVPSSPLESLTNALCNLRFPRRTPTMALTRSEEDDDRSRSCVASALSSLPSPSSSFLTRDRTSERAADVKGFKAPPRSLRYNTAVQPQVRENSYTHSRSALQLSSAKFVSGFKAERLTGHVAQRT